MKKYLFNLTNKTAYTLMLFCIAHITWAQEITGTWKISDVEFVKSNPSSGISKENCYLCDLYNSGYGLMFNADGTVAYEENRSNYKVKYAFSGNKLTMYLADENADDKAEGQVNFSAELKGNSLTIKRVTTEFTEVYYLQKQ
ncbi:MAG: hypothetical protein KIS94_00935 [Chitinophagales bacterium]|nr:hypothetical protein [Chitinophagales bacterium]